MNKVHWEHFVVDVIAQLYTVDRQCDDMYADMLIAVWHLIIYKVSTTLAMSVSVASISVCMYYFSLYTVSQKNDTALACYYFNVH